MAVHWCDGALGKPPRDVQLRRDSHFMPLLPYTACVCHALQSPRGSPQDGTTPLMTAIRKGSAEVVELLLEEGARTELINTVRGWEGW